MAEQFFADEFFAAQDDASTEVLVPLRGRQVPMRLRAMNYADRVAAQAKAVTREMDAFGNVRVKAVDEVIATAAILARVIVSWPFVERDGSPTPITEANVTRLLDTGTERLLAIVDALSKGQAEKLLPFVARSATPSPDAPAAASPESPPEVSPSA